MRTAAGMGVYMRIATFSTMISGVMEQQALSKPQEAILICSMIAVLIFVICLVLVRRKTKAVNKALEEKEACMLKCRDLSKALEEAENSQKEISEKYEEIKRNEEKNRKMAYTDHITGLPNRFSFTEILDGVIKTLRKDEEFALMYIDMDNFKTINETLGHSYGDELLIDATDRIKQVMDENDYLACFGGDEFTVITQNIEDISDYNEKIKKIQNVFSYPFILAAKEVFVTISIGVCMAPKDGKTTQTLLKNLDSALYAAKNGGKNTYCFYNEEINKDLKDKIELQSQLRTAIENKEFAVYYQPCIELLKGAITGFEALVRWNHPTKKVVSPGEFIAVAEETGLIVPIGGWVLTEALNQVKQWEEEGYGQIHISVNLSLRQFKDSGLLDLVSEAVSNTGIAPWQLELEITEAAALDNLAYTIETMKALKLLGVSVALDNYGKHYSSLRYLKQLPVNHLKIDNSFLENVAEDKKDQVIIESILSLANSFGIGVIAQGVESSGQEAFLKNCGCRYAQGFLYSGPVLQETAKDMMNLLRNGGTLDDFY